LSFYNFGRYLVTQILVVSPVLWLSNWRAFLAGLKNGFKENNQGALYLASWCLPFFLGFTGVSFFYWVKLNWLWPGYLAATVLAVLLAAQGKMKGWFRAELGGSLALTLILVPLLFYQPLAVHWSGNSLAGWKELAYKVEKMAAKRGGAWEVAGYEYKAASELAFYLPGQPETYSNSLIGQPGLQYDYWFDESKIVGKNFLFMVDRRYGLKDASQVLTKFFKRVESPDSLTVKSGRGYVTTFYIYPCYDYQGFQNRDFPRPSAGLPRLRSEQVGTSRLE
jgi:undecaprenyl-diphosphatase